MAKPAFIYAFDNLGPERFTELCGQLLASRHKGFLLGGTGPDGGVDAELDETLGLWRPESEAALLNKIIRPGQAVIFQFKHKVTARVGQIASRKQLLSLYKCQGRKKCELHKNLIVSKRPAAYVLVTNIEVNSEFRETFINQCRYENPNVKHYQIIGLDELETWITNQIDLRHLYFPTIFGLSNFNLKVKLDTVLRMGIRVNPVEILCVTVLNVGSTTSYIDSVNFKVILNGEIKILSFPPHNAIMQSNPKPGFALDPGRHKKYIYPFELLRKWKQAFFIEVAVKDELGNEYHAPITELLRDWLKPKQ